MVLVSKNASRNAATAFESEGAPARLAPSRAVPSRALRLTPEAPGPASPSRAADVRRLCGLTTDARPSHHGDVGVVRLMRSVGDPRSVSEMLDIDVGLSDTWAMTANVYAVPLPRRAMHASAGDETAPVFDASGMPMSLAAARSMTDAAIEAALVRVAAKLRFDPDEAAEPTEALDSIEVAFLIGRFYRDLGRPSPDLSKIARRRWSTLRGVAQVLHDLMRAAR